MAVAGTALLLFAVVHTIWTGFHAPLAAWVSPLGLGLLAAGLWSTSTRHPLPRWATGLLWAVAAALAAVLIWQVIYILTRHYTFT